MLNFLAAAGKALFLAAKAKPVATALTVASTALTAKQYQATKEAGKQAQQQLDQQAANSLLEGRSAAISYRQQGANELKDLNNLLATQTARASAGGVEVTSGNPYAIAQADRRKAISNYYKYQDAALQAAAGMQQQAELYSQAGVDARKAYRDAALFSATTSILNLARDFKPLSLQKPTADKYFDAPVTSVDTRGKA
jgi:hypothetical protein